MLGAGIALPALTEDIIPVVTFIIPCVSSGVKNILSPFANQR
ncbi:MAG: hypothetical protein WD972_03695 [Candidatus Andersenbacteria bacterium]